MQYIRWMLAAGLSLACACTSRTLQIDAEAVEASIKDSLAQQGEYAHRVECTRGVEAKRGAQIRCHVSIRDRQYDQIGTLTDVASGHIDLAWERGEAVLAKKLVAVMTPQLADRSGVPATINCDEPLLFVDKDRKVRCPATVGGVPTELITTVDAQLRPTRFDIAPQVVVRSKLEQLVTPSVRDSLGASVTVACDGGAALPRPAGKALDVLCTVQTSAGPVRISAHIESDAAGGLSALSWKRV